MHVVLSEALQIGKMLIITQGLVGRCDGGDEHSVQRKHRPAFL